MNLINPVVVVLLATKKGDGYKVIFIGKSADVFKLFGLANYELISSCDKYYGRPGVTTAKRLIEKSQ